ncbi:transducin beta-like 3 [Holotrichia oblita]|uniref:Transducin beta-like 3 n=1 Tax=Holotrichia oblita TaxID=644536 RepID=A0ACB9SSI9_HOLOL|nr:transducin beta-like 3 [Holotrichia oblita]
MAVLPPDPVFILKGDMGYIHSLSFLNCEKDHTSTLLVATEAGFVHIWDLETNRMKYKQSMGESIQVVHSIDQNIVTQEKSGMLKVWNVSESQYENVCSYECYGGYCKSLILNENLIVPQANGKLDIIDLNMTKISTLNPLDDRLGNCMCLEKATINGATYVLAGYETGDIILYDLKSNKSCSKIKLRECITSISYDPLTCRGIVGNSSNMLQLFTIDKTLNMVLKCEINITNEGCNIVKIRQDRKIFVSGSWDGKLRLFSWKSLRLLVLLNEHRKTISDVQFSPNIVNYWKSNIMAVSSGDGSVSLWNLYN